MSCTHFSGHLFTFPFLAMLLAFDAHGGEITGWRTDGTGSYPKAQPPLTWSDSKNVVWKSPMPGMSNSLPVLVGHRVFICADKGTLLCLHRDDGKILWQKSSSYDELEIDAETRTQLKVELVAADQLLKQQAALAKESDLLRRKLKDDMTAKAEIDKKLDELKKQTEALKAQHQKLTLAVRHTEPKPQSTAGYSSPTPVTNGREVFVAFANGLVACFDLDGNRKWLKLIEHSNAPFAHSGSPLLADDKLLIHFTDLVALNPKDGSEVWRHKRQTTHGTGAITTIDKVAVLLTPNGAMIRVSDGKLLTDKLGSTGANSPVLHEGCVYYVRSSSNAIRLPATLMEPVKVEPLWKANIKGSGYWFSSPVLHEGLLYAANDQGIMTVVEAATGKVVYEQRLDHGGSTYPSVSLAGNRVYISSDKGTTVVMQTGREYKELARNNLDPFRSSLVFDGKRLYVRTLKYLYCIGE